MSKSIGDYALQYRNNGLAVFPLIGKSPACEWAVYQKRLPSEEQIKIWWGINKNYNVGISTGGISKLFVIDFDYEALSIMPKSLPIIKSIIQDNFIMTKTGKGYHVLIKCLNPLTTKNQIVAKSKTGERRIETRGHGGYIVAPPSIHPKYKKEYFFMIGGIEKYKHIKKVSQDDINSILDSLHNAFNDYNEKIKTNTSSEKIVDGVLRVRDRDQFIAAVLKKEIAEVQNATAGNRNDVLFKSAANLGKFTKFIDEGKIYECLLEACQENGYIMDDGASHAAKTIRSALKRVSPIDIVESPFLDIFGE